MTDQFILIIALSARPFLSALKRAGYKVTAIDAFADTQTIAMADQSIVVPYDQNGFNADALLAAISTLDVAQYLGFLYGSGFDAQPDLLEKIAHILPIIGNPPKVVSDVKTAKTFFGILQQSQVTYPSVYETLPERFHQKSILQKFSGGSGGGHITIVCEQQPDTLTLATESHYFQQYIEGLPVSLLFMADNENIEVIGYNEQWVNSSLGMPFQYAGAVNNIDLPLSAKQQLREAATHLTRKFGLIGLNSVDAILKKNKVYVLEVNPRLSATFELYEDKKGSLIYQHMQVCLKQATLTPYLQPSKQYKAHAIVYAETTITISAQFDWPEWAMDYPRFNMQFPAIILPANAPVCSVIAVAQSADDAKKLAQSRVKELLTLLISNQQD